MRKRVKRFRTRLRKLHADTSPETVHQFRIACRELLACKALLKKFAPSKSWKEYVKQALDSLDELRDLQQLREQLQELAATAATIKALDKPLRRAMTAWEDMDPILKDSQFTKALTAMEKALNDESVGGNLRKAWRKQWQKSLRRVHECAAAADAADPESLHRLRVRYKRLRYLLEVKLDSGISIPIRKPQLKRWQDELGGIQNCRVMGLYADKLKLPARLQQHFVQRAAERANRFIKKRDTFLAFLSRLERELEKHDL